jgi:beta-glucanase (GH16 family)
MKRFFLLSAMLISLVQFSGCNDVVGVNDDSKKQSNEANLPLALSFPVDEEGSVGVQGFRAAQVKETLKMVWNDEFNGNTLDDSKWSPAPEWPRQGGSHWSDDNFEMTGQGQVKLKVTEKNGKVYAGAIRTHKKFDQKYGYFEVRCKLPEIRGGWAAFWLMPYGNNPGSWGDDGTEIDVFESINGWNGKINHALHWDGYGSQHQKASQSIDRPDLYDGQYHVFGMLWTPKEYIFYIDNVESWRSSAGGVADVNQYLKLTLEVSDGTWAGNWKNQETKNIDWLVDYVRVYNDKPASEPGKPFGLNFSSLQSGATVNTGATAKMDVTLTGDLNGADELEFLSKKGDADFVSEKSVSIGSKRDHAYAWKASQAGNYTLRVTAKKNGSYVAHHMVNITVKGAAEPFSIGFADLKSGSSFKGGANVNMDIKISGNQSKIDQLIFLTRIDGGSFVEQAKINVNQASTYKYNWKPSQSGLYTLRVTAKKNDSYVTHLMANNITIQNEPKPEPEPFKMNFSDLKSGSTFLIGEQVKMDVDLSGDLSKVDQLQFLFRNENGNFIEQATVNVTSGSNYTHRWIPSQSGNYTLRVTAKKNNGYVTHLLANNITIEKKSDPFDISYTALSYGDTYKVGDNIKMTVAISGELSSADELQFTVQKSGESASLLHKVSLSSDQTVHVNNWIPSELGEYNLKVAAYKNGILIKDIAAVVTIVDPLRIKYNNLKNGKIYKVGSKIKMNVKVTGDLSQASEIHFVVQRNGGVDKVVKTKALTIGQNSYSKRWKVTEPGNYKLKTQIYNGRVFITHTVVNVKVIPRR